MSRNAKRSPMSASLIACSILTLPLLAALAACGPQDRGLNLTVESYVTAVQQRDQRMMAYLWAPYRRDVRGLSAEEQQKVFDDFSAIIAEARAAYDQAKESGNLTPDPFGVGLFRALGLGQGAISIPISARLDEGGSTASVRTRVVTNLDNLRLQSLPDGVRVYLMGYPLGRLEMISVGYDDISKLRLLGSVDIDWKLSRAPEGIRSPAGWLIESLAPDPNSAEPWEPGRHLL